jgi:hypothetical protein
LVELKRILTEKNLTDNELKLGEALVEIFENYETIFVGPSNNKYNKNIILLSLREMTNLNTKEIRSAIKKYKIIYLGMLEKMMK